MDPQRFDELARRLSTGSSRRAVLRGVASGLAGVLLGQGLTEAKGGCRKRGTPCSEDDDCCSGACHRDARGRGRCDSCPDVQCGDNEYADPRDCLCHCAAGRAVCGDGEICTLRGCQCPQGQKLCAGSCIDENACCTVADCPPNDACVTYSCVGGTCLGAETVCTIGGGSGACEVASCEPEIGCVTTNLPANERGRCSDGWVCCDDGACHELGTVDNCGACGDICESPDPCTPAACIDGVCQAESVCSATGETCLRARSCDNFTCADTTCTSTNCPCPRVGEYQCDAGVIDLSGTINCDRGDGLPT